MTISTTATTRYEIKVNFVAYDAPSYFSGVNTLDNDIKYVGNIDIDPAYSLDDIHSTIFQDINSYCDGFMIPKIISDDDIKAAIRDEFNDTAFVTDFEVLGSIDQQNENSDIESLQLYYTVSVTSL